MKFLSPYTHVGHGAEAPGFSLAPAVNPIGGDQEVENSVSVSLCLCVCV